MEFVSRVCSASASGTGVSVQIEPQLGRELVVFPASLASLTRSTSIASVCKLLAAKSVLEDDVRSGRNGFSSYIFFFWPMLIRLHFTT